MCVLRLMVFTLTNVNNLQTELNVRVLSSNANSKTEFDTISDLSDNADVNFNTLNEIANAINKVPVICQNGASIQGFATLVKPSPSSNIFLPLHNSEGTCIFYQIVIRLLIHLLNLLDNSVCFLV